MTEWVVSEWHIQNCGDREQSEPVHKNISPLREFLFASMTTAQESSSSSSSSRRVPQHLTLLSPRNISKFSAPSLISKFSAPSLYAVIEYMASLRVRPVGDHASVLLWQLHASQELRRERNSLDLGFDRGLRRRGRELDLELRTKEVESIVSAGVIGQGTNKGKASGGKLLMMLTGEVLRFRSWSWAHWEVRVREALWRESNRESKGEWGVISRHCYRWSLWLLKTKSLKKMKKKKKRKRKIRLIKQGNAIEIFCCRRRSNSDVISSLWTHEFFNEAWKADGGTVYGLWFQSVKSRGGVCGAH